MRTPLRLLILLFVGLTGPVSAQTLQITPADPVTNSLDSIIQALVGENVEISNISTAPGVDIVSYGSFSDTLDDGTNGTVGVPSGLIMTTGDVNNALGPNLLSGAATNNGSPNSSTLLSALATGAINDACIISFDISTSSDTIAFNYVFASEEYNSFVGSTFNDVFGFFIEGPGIEGDPGLPANTKNIALIPETTTPVSINNVNLGNGTTPASFPEFYINNVPTDRIGDQPLVPIPPDPARVANVEYDGLTRRFTAFSPVQPCQTYRLTFAISDVGDGTLDSGVFIEAGSLRGLGVNIEPTSEYATRFEYGVEGCADGRLIFKRREADNGVEDKLARFEILGTATNGVDYLVDGEPMPDSVIIPAGIDSVEFIIDAIDDEIDEVFETIVIVQIDACLGGDVTGDSTTLIIRDELLYEVPDYTFCYGDTAFAINVDNPNEPIVVDDENPPFEYSWAPDYGLSCTDCASPTIFPDTTTTYFVTISDPVSGCTKTDTLVVTVNVTPDVTASTRFNEGCDPASVVISRPADYPLDIPFKVRFGLEGDAENETDFGLADGSPLPDSVIVPAGEASLELFITAFPDSDDEGPETLIFIPDDFCTEDPDTFFITIFDEFRYFVPDEVYCVGIDSIVLNVNNPNQPAVGAPEYIYNWEPSAGLSCTDCESPNAAPDTTTAYVFTVTDPLSGCVVTDTVVVDAFTLPQATVVTADQEDPTITFPELAACDGESIFLIAAAVVNQGDVDYSWDVENESLINFVADSTLFIPTLRQDEIVYLTTTNDIGCSTIDTLLLRAVTPPTIITPLSRTFCFDEPITLDLFTTGQSVVWTFEGQEVGFDTTFTFQPPTVDTTYSFVAQTFTGNCSSDPVTVEARVTAPLDTAFTVTPVDPEQGFVAPTTVTLDGAATGGVVSRWVVTDVASSTVVLDTTLQANAIQDFNYTFNRSQFGTYLVELITADASLATCLQSNIQFIVIQSGSLFIPNVFTPNDDGANDTFVITTADENERSIPSQPVLGGELKVYDRWGKEIYSSDTYLNDWAGEDDLNGTYFYRFVSPIGDREERTGWVTIMR